MVWQKFSDRARESRKIRSCSDSAFRLWWAIGNWCSEHETDGYIPKGEVKDAWRPLARKRFRYAECCQELVEIGLLEDHETAFKVHDFEQFNPPKVVLEQRRSGGRERVSRHRSRQKEQQKPANNNEVTHINIRVTDVLGNGPRPVPSRPDPDQRDHATRALSDARASEDEFTADTMWLRFARAWHDAFKTFPTQGGKGLGDFHERVMKTAAAQNTAPAALYDRALRKYLARKHTAVELRAPYACFAQAWSELTAQPNGEMRKTGGLSLEEYRERTRREIEASRPAEIGGVRV